MDKDLIPLDSLLENIIDNFVVDIPVDIKVDDSDHMKDRQWRHGEEGFITLKEIIKLIQLSSRKLIRQMVLDSINIGEYVLLTDGGLNIVTNLKQSGLGITIKIITIMRKDNFKPKPGTKVIRI